MLMAAFAVLLVRGRPVVACSAGPEYNPVAASEIIVAGWCEAWDVAPAGEVTGPYAPIVVTMSVDEVFKGSAPRELMVADGASRAADAWVGASGACGAFDADPTGMYAILGLRRDVDGYLHAHRFRIFFLGPEPSGPEYEAAVSYLAPLRAPPEMRAAVRGSASVVASLARLAGW